MRVAIHRIVCSFPIFQRETVEFVLDDTLFESINLKTLRTLKD